MRDRGKEGLKSVEEGRLPQLEREIHQRLRVSPCPSQKFFASASSSSGSLPEEAARGCSSLMNKEIAHS